MLIRPRQVRLTLTAVAALALAACDRGTVTAPGGDPELAQHAHGRGSAGVVYASTNSAEANAVGVFLRAADGTLTAAGLYPTGGRGTGQSLGSQGAVVLSDDRRWLFVANAGSDDISVFAVTHDGLALVDRASSGGRMPVSLAYHRRWLYALNAGSDDIAGFRVGRDGRLTPLPNSVRPLSGHGTAPAQVAFTPDGSQLVVAEKMTNRIDTYAVGDDGTVSGPLVQPSQGQTPFGFEFDQRGRLIVSEAFGGAPGHGAMSSYALSSAGWLQVVSGSIRNGQTASCWVVITNNGRYTYTSNTGSGSLSSYRIGRDGSLALLDPQAGLTGDGSMPIDMALSANSRFLYVLEEATGAISAFRVGADGSLDFIGEVDQLPAFAAGAAAR